MKYFVYALYSPSYKMIKIGRTKNFKQRWKDLSHWDFDYNKSFALCCDTNQGHKRIEDTLKILVPSKKLWVILNLNLPKPMINKREV